MVEDPVILQRRPLPRKDEPRLHHHHQYGRPEKPPVKTSSYEHRPGGRVHDDFPDTEDGKVYYYVMNGPQLFPWRTPRTLPKLKRRPMNCENVFDSGKFPHKPADTRMAGGRYFIDYDEDQDVMRDDLMDEMKMEASYDSMSYHNLNANPSVPDYVRVKPWRFRLLEQQQQQHGQLDVSGDQPTYKCTYCSKGKRTETLSNSSLTFGTDRRNNSPSGTQRSHADTRACSCSPENAVVQAKDGMAVAATGETEKMELDSLFPLNDVGVMSADGTELNLKGYFLQDLPSVWPAFCCALTSVDLSYNNFKAVPESLCSLEHLESLNMRNNPLASLPKQLRKLEKLKYLNLSHCLFEKLSKTICTLTSLNILDMSYNLITEVHPNIAELSSLQELILDGNMISSFPPSMLRLNLQTLQCNLNFTHKLFWNESCRPGAPQRLFDSALLVMLRDEELSALVPSQFRERVGGLGCACCGGVMVGEGVEVLKPVAEVFGVKFLPLLFRVCSHRCRVAFKRTDQSPCPQ